jgi:O-antigen ligase
LIRALILLGCFESAYGMIQYLTGFQKIFTYTKQYYIEEATGTYINHNHFAGFLELVLPWVVAQTYFLLRPKGAVNPSASSRSGSSSSRVSRPSAYLYVFLVVVILIAIVFSRSRMGIFSALLSLIFMAAVTQIREKNRALVGITLAIVCAALAYAAWIGLSPVLARFEALEHGGLTTEGRVSFWKSDIALVRDYPIFGTGLGTFEYAFSAYQDSLLELRVDHAHNDYLEFSSDLGLPGAALLFGPILYLLGKMIVVLTSDRSRYRRSVLLGCIGSVIGLLTHTVADFNLHIPANALVFAVILGLGYKVACLEPTVTYAIPRGRAAPVGRGVDGGDGGAARTPPA